MQPKSQPKPLRPLTFKYTCEREVEGSGFRVQGLRGLGFRGSVFVWF